MLKSSKILHFLLLSHPPSPQQVQSFAQWLRDYPAKEKVVIAGHQGSEVQHHNVSQRD
jgi:outer membrane protein OmpA-like peptidoglycan-associated protein